MILGLGFSACDKHFTDLEEKDPLMLEMQNNFKHDSLIFYRSLDKSTYNYRQSLTRIINWSSAKLIRDSLIVPVTLKLPNNELDKETGTNTLPHKVYLVVSKNMVVSKNATVKFNYLMKTYIKTDNKLNGKFDGVILDEDYFLGNVRYSTYSNGIKDKYKGSSSTQIKLLAKAKASGLIASILECNWITIGTTCVPDFSGANNPDICGSRYEYLCNWNHNEQETSIIDYEGGGGGNDNNNSNTIYDCANVLGGSAYIGECGKCVGGTTGISSCAEIKNFIINPCLKEMVNNILSKNLELKTDITLQSIFGINTSFNLTFRESTSLPNNTGGVAIGKSNSFNGTMEKLNVEIQLNVNTLQNASQEYISMVIIHESIHAYLYSKGIIGDPWPFGEHLNAQHEIMWVNYVDFISNYLVENFGTPLKDANSLAMEGLHRTLGSKLNDEIYLAINKKAKEPISDERARINSKYRLGQLGTKCNN